MIESPLLREIEARGRMQAHVADILRLLHARFGEVPEEIRARLSGIQDETALEDLVMSTHHCPDLRSFRTQLPN
jgi:hypothetical protein